MNLDNLNRWLTLLANLGVLAGILVVAIELQQTQTEMKAESSSMRAAMARENNLWAVEFDMQVIGEKILKGEELSPADAYRSTIFFGNLLRYFETMHYQYQLGVLDEESWRSQSRVIGQMCNGENSSFSHFFPNGINGRAYRESFIELFNAPCE